MQGTPQIWGPRAAALVALCPEPALLGAFYEVGSTTIKNKHDADADVG
jgi:hypothetical protein